MITIALGVAIVVEPFAYSMWSDAPAGQRIVDRFESTLSGPGLVALPRNFATVGNMASQLFAGTLPSVRRKMHLSVPEFAR